jgi:alanyl-tRNA synthetase
MSTTDRLYYNDQALRAFDAEVLRVEPRNDRIAVWLDRTAFYPTSGGQPFDLGTLGGATVLDVADDEEGNVVHLVDAVPPAGATLGATVHGEIDWTRRFDHMQQHTGQHVLSAVLERTCNARTLSFHLGTAASTIDVDRELTSGEIARGEEAVNSVVWNDVPVSIRYATEDEARRLPLRKEPARGGTLRLIDIEGVDLSACGGTHVPRTGAIGQVVVTSWERFKGGQRIQFLCGARALARFQQLRDTVAASTRVLSVLAPELPGCLERLLIELKDQKRALAAAGLELAKHDAAGLFETAEQVAGGRAVLQAVDGDALRLKALASAIVARPGVLAVIVSRSTPVLAVAARAADVNVSCQEIISALLKEFGGRGGGRPDLAQCGGLNQSPDVILAATRTWLASLR